jgi:hypothetical protein
MKRYSLAVDFVMEAPGDEYPAAQPAFCQTMKSWRSNLNPELATTTFYITFLLIVVVGAYATMKAHRLYSRAITEGSKNVQA